MSARPLAVVPAWRWWAGFGVVVAIAAGASLIAYGPGLPDAFGRHQVDKALHFFFAGFLAFFLDGAMARRAAFRIGAWAMPLAAVLVIVPTGIEEYLQRYSVVRTSSFLDFVADVAGVACFIPLSRRAAK
jgi:VanZ family protein